MISREDVAKTAWRAVSNAANHPAPPLTEDEWEPVWRERLTPRERDLWYAAADALLPLLQAEVERVEKERDQWEAARNLAVAQVEYLHEELARRRVDLDAGQAALTPLTYERNRYEALYNNEVLLHARDQATLGAKDKVLHETRERLKSLLVRGDFDPSDVPTTVQWLHRVDCALSLTPAAVGEAVGRLVQAVQSLRVAYELDQEDNSAAQDVCAAYDAPELAAWRGK